MKFIESIKQIQEFGEVIFGDDQEDQWEAYKRRAQKDGYGRYLSNSGYQPHPLPKGMTLSPPNRGSSVQPSKEDIKRVKEKCFPHDFILPGFDADKFDAGDCLVNIKVKEYNHLVNERDWYKERMEEYRDSFWKFDPPGAGKSTGAAYIFSQLKLRGINAEFVTEFAKDKTWEHNNAALSDQLYMFGKQHFKISRCIDQVDVIVTDSPLFLSILYNDNPVLGEDFNQLVVKVFNSYRSLNYFIRRTKPYNPTGRNQTEEESSKLGLELKDLLVKYSIDARIVKGEKEGYDQILQDVLEELGESDA